MRPDEETKIAEWALKFIKKHDQNGTLWVESLLWTPGVLLFLAFLMLF